MKFKNLDDYLNHLLPHQKKALIEIQQYVHQKNSTIQVRLSYQMMAFKWDHILFYIGAMKHHIGLYPSQYMNDLLPYIDKFKHSKGAIQIPYDQVFPYHLLDIILKRGIQK